MTTTGVVLCGGQSRRMGRDKALVEVDGVPMAERVARALVAGGCASVVLVGGDGAALSGLGRTWVADRWPGEGPFAGVITALAETGTNVLIAACDLPDLDVATVRSVLRASADEPSVDVVVAVTDRVEPALSWWSAAGRDTFDAAWSAGTRALRDAIAGVTARQVPVARSALRNVNEPADLAATADSRLGHTDVRR